jgi:hypothetical protein
MKTDIETDIFYYVLERHCEKDGADCVEHYVMPYAFDEKWRHCFDEGRMFATMQEANEFADKMNGRANGKQ